MLLNCIDLYKTYHMGDTVVRALDGVSLRIDAGEFVAVMGPSGSGKSTLLHVLGLLDSPDRGVYELLGRDVARVSENDLAALRSRRLGFIFQQFMLLPRLTALENTALPVIYSGNGNGGRASPEDLLSEVGLADRMHHAPNKLSGGQQQRVAIARALMNRPSLILADEPTGNLDTASQNEIMSILQNLNARGITIVMVTHEEEVAERARRIIRMRDGHIISDDRKVPGRDFSQSAPGTASGESEGSGEIPRIGWKLVAREFREHVLQAVRALFANKVRTLLSVLGILIGVAAVIAMLALGQGAKASIETRLASMGSNLLVLRPGSRQSHGVALEAGSVTRFTTADAEEILGIPGVRRVSPSVTGRGQVAAGNLNWNTQITGVLPEYADMRAARPEVGRFFTADEEQSRAKVAVIGMTVVRELFGKVAERRADGGASPNPIGESVKINRVNFQVIGILPEKGATTWRDEDDRVAVPLSTAMKRLFGKEYVDNIDIEVSRAEDIPDVEEAVRRTIIKRHRLPPSLQESFQIRNMAELQETLTETSRTLSTLLASIAAISLLVGGIGIMNIMLVSVTERTREIGLRKALGARPRDILWQFLIEAVVVSVFGGLAGIFLGWLITVGMSKLAGWAAAVSPDAVFLAFGFSAAVGMIFGFWPARKAAALSPIDALRYE
ncbi:ABC transporter permease [bacterium]|nr:ABC transporter permease [bacterium]